MGLDMRPMGKPKPGFEKRFVEIFEMVTHDASDCFSQSNTLYVEKMHL